MPARLLRKIGSDRGEYSITGETTIGRHPDNTITLGRDAVSGKHARIRFDPVRGRYLLEDLGSRNGTRLDGERIRDAEPLGHLHVITFADADFIFQDLQLTAERQGWRGVAQSSNDPRPISQRETDKLQPQLPHEASDELPAERTLFQSGAPILPPVLPKFGEAPEAHERTEFEALPMALPSALAAGKARAKPGDKGSRDDSRPREGTEPLERDQLDAARSVGAESVESTPANVLPAEPRAAKPDGEAERVPAPFYLVLTDTDLPSRRFRLHMGENLIGRGNEADIQLESLNLSRRHATLTIGESTLYLRDEGSRNHTFVNDVQLDAEAEIPLSSRLRFGAVEGWLLPIAGEP